MKKVTDRKEGSCFYLHSSLKKYSRYDTMIWIKSLRVKAKNILLKCSNSRGLYSGEAEYMTVSYSAGLTSKLFWLQESRKTAGYILAGYSKTDIRKIAWEENIYQVKAEYRAYEVLNGTYRRMSALPEAVLRAFTTCDVETAKILNLIAILMDSRLFFEFLHEVYAEKLRLGEKEITDRDLNVFFSDKAMQSGVVAGWTEAAVRKLKQCLTKMMYEAGLLENSAKPRSIRPVHIDYRTEELLNTNGLSEYLKVVKGV